MEGIARVRRWAGKAPVTSAVMEQDFMHRLVSAVHTLTNEILPSGTMARMSSRKSCPC